MKTTLSTKQQFWKDHIEQALSEKVSLTDYAKQHNLDLKALYNYKSILLKKARYQKPRVPLQKPRSYLSQKPSCRCQSMSGFPMAWFWNCPTRMQTRLRHSWHCDEVFRRTGLPSSGSGGLSKTNQWLELDRTRRHGNGCIFRIALCVYQSITHTHQDIVLATQWLLPVDETP